VGVTADWESISRQELFQYEHKLYTKSKQK